MMGGLYQFFFGFEEFCNFAKPLTIYQQKLAQEQLLDMIPVVGASRMNTIFVNQGLDWYYCWRCDLLGLV